jgi:hypothetical protein
LNKNEKLYLILIFISWNEIGAEGAAKLGEGLSNLLKLTTLNMDIR